jgi:hypothetical protein
VIGAIPDGFKTIVLPTDISPIPESKISSESPIDFKVSINISSIFNNHVLGIISL